MECFDGLNIIDPLSIDLNKTCRVCLCFIESDDRISLFSKSNIYSMDYKLLLIKCVSTEVSGDDGLPDAICGKCEHDLRAAYEFILRFQESNEKLKHILNQIQILDSQTFYKGKDMIWSPPTAECDIFFPLGESVKYEDQLEEEDLEDISTNINKMKENVIYKTNKKKIKKEKGTRFQCFGCEKNFATTSALNTHIKKNHTEKREYTCQKCGKQFFDRSSVTQHAKIHNETLSFGCSQCPKIFKYSANLHRHESSHTKLKPFICNVCSKGFAMKNYLVQHLRVHSDVKRFRCQICGKEIKTWNGLKSHKFVHSNEKPFPCSFCETHFASKSGLRQHINTHHQSNKSAGSRMSKKGLTSLPEYSKSRLKEILNSIKNEDL